MTSPASNGAHPAPTTNPRVTLASLARMAERPGGGEPFACLTCYDFTTARWLARAGVHVLLVGDTAAEMILGFGRTIDMPLDVLLALTAGVKRGGPDRVVMGDMPFMSYQACDADAVRNAGRFLTEGLADIVKIEADESFAPLVEKMTRAGIPVCGHVGSKPQQVGLTGSYSAAGRTAVDAASVVADAVALERAGSRMLLIEAVPEEVTRRVLERTRVPVIGIGAGPACHGQVLVLQDLLGLTDAPPRFAEPLAALGRTIETAARAWCERVAARRVGGEGYTMKPGEAEKFGASAPVNGANRPAG
jgi:3-methyl-2-oxobutanoate hydroxymethyltransferase